MGSPFGDVEELNRARLYYTKTESGAIASVDPITGVQYKTQQKSYIEAYVKVLSPNNIPESQLAKAPYTMKVRVYCISPMFLPSEVGQGDVLDYEFTEGTRILEGASQRTQKGKLTITKFLTSPFSVVNEVMGDVFDGYLVVGT